MRKKVIKSESDVSFQEAMRDVTLIKPKKLQLTSKRRQTESLSADPQMNDYASYPPIEECDPEARLFFARPGLQTKLLRRFKQGKLSIESQLDLHGMSWIEAESSLQTFLTYCQRNKYKVILIIPGKGQVLKARVNSMLRELENVLAFCSAQPKHGGTGALYILLKHTRGDD